VDVKTIGTQLSDRFRFLTDGLRTAPARQRTLRAAIDWSNDLLTVAERELFYRLSVFAGTFDTYSAEAVCAGGSVPQEQVQDLVGRLLGKSLLVGVDTLSGRRYRQLESIRAYALDRLKNAGELEQFRRAHAERFAELAEMGFTDPTEVGRSQYGWAARMLPELDNVREALGWSESADHELHLRLATGMGRFCINYALISEGCAWLDRAIKSDLNALPLLRAHAAEVASLLSYRRDDHDGAEMLASEAVRLCRRFGNDALVSAYLGTLGFVRIGAMRLKEAEEPIIEQLAIAETLGDEALQESALYNLGVLETHRGELDDAHGHLARSLALAEAGSRDTRLIHKVLGWGMLQMRDLDGARASIAKCIVLDVQQLNLSGLAMSLDEAAELAFLERAHERAMRLKGAADAIRDSGGGTVPSMSAVSRARWVSRAERSLGKASRTAWLEGRQLSIEEAAAYALAPTDSRMPRVGVTGERFLSRREIEVSELVAQGMTNDQIATRLRLSKRTVDAHLEHIRTKLGVRSRVEIATWLRTRQEASLS
jgi:non-specific serine/threonine protein kinase